MSGLDHGNALERPAVAVARHRDAGEAVRRQIKTVEIYFFRDLGHRAGGFACGEHNQPGRPAAPAAAAAGTTPDALLLPQCDNSVCEKSAQGISWPLHLLPTQLKICLYSLIGENESAEAEPDQGGGSSTQ